jgi:glycosyltransferase involved in cell wall biosynthesis
MKRNRPRLGIYCPGIGLGGPWRYVHSILSGLDPAEFDVSVYCDLPGIYEPKPSVKVIRLSEPALNRTMPPPQQTNAISSRRIWTPKSVSICAGFFKEARRLCALFQRHPMDVFHTQLTGFEEAPVAAKLAGIPHVIGTFHVDSTYDLHKTRSGPTHRILEMISNQCLDRAIAVSHATKRDWVSRTHISPARVVTIHNGIDADKFRRRQNREQARLALGLPVDALIVGGLGRLEEAKGFNDLITAIAYLQKDVTNLYAVIAGEGPLKEALLFRALDLGISDRLKLLGFQRDVQPVLDALDMFVMPSICETLGYAALEAMATELPVVATRVGGIPEVVVDGETGFLVPKRDSMALANKLNLLLVDPLLRSRMGSAGRERILSCFNEQRMVSETVAMLS